MLVIHKHTSLATSVLPSQCMYVCPPLSLTLHVDEICYIDPSSVSSCTWMRVTTYFSPWGYTVDACNYTNVNGFPGLGRNMATATVTCNIG